jgi:ribosomal protein S18 acetylase RimI-like enzyme
MAAAIRQLGPGDGEVLATLARDAADFDLAGRSGPDEPLSAADAAEYLSHPAVLHWVAEDDGRVVGELLCHVLPLGFGAGREMLLYSIGVRSAYRRRGVGRALVEQMLRHMTRAGIPEVWVLADNPEAELFYGACGFVRGREHEQGVLMLRDAPAG